MVADFCHFAFSLFRTLKREKAKKRNSEKAKKRNFNTFMALFRVVMQREKAKKRRNAREKAKHVKRRFIASHVALFRLFAF